jgi:hypothetical protein
VTRIAVIHYSGTENVHAPARAVADGAAGEGACVRLRHVAELPPGMATPAGTKINPSNGTE